MQVVVAGAGSIGSLLAAHLARVADVTVLTRREEHADGCYASAIMEKLAATPYDEMIACDIVWVGTPDDVIQRIRETIEV
jgi:ketopantoate reductase